MPATVTQVMRSIPWLPRPTITALYVSAGADLRPITLTHPQILARQAGMSLEAPTFFVYVDQARSDDPNLTFDDERTHITTISCRSLMAQGFDASLLRLRFASIDLPSRDVAVLRVHATNDDFANAVLAEGWSPDIFIGTNDGCGAFGQNHRCENQLTDPEQSIPARLGASWWITDHLPGSTATGGDDPNNGDIIRSLAPKAAFSLRQVAFLCTSWRSNVAGSLRLYGGSRLFEVLALRPSTTPAHTMRHGLLCTPKANKRLA